MVYNTSTDVSCRTKRRRFVVSHLRPPLPPGGPQNDPSRRESKRDPWFGEHGSSAAGGRRNGDRESYNGNEGGGGVEERELVEPPTIDSHYTGGGGWGVAGGWGGAGGSRATGRGGWTPAKGGDDDRGRESRGGTNNRGGGVKDQPAVGERLELSANRTRGRPGGGIEPAHTDPDNLERNGESRKKTPKE